MYISPEANGESGQVWLLLKALYGLKQAPRVWNDEIHKTLTTVGFKRSPFDEGLYIRRDCWLLLYVDDLLIAVKELKTVQYIKRLLVQKYAMKDLGEAKQFLGIQIEYNRQEGTIKLHQSNAIQALLERYGVERANPVHT